MVVVAELEIFLSVSKYLSSFLLCKIINDKNLEDNDIEAAPMLIDAVLQNFRGLSLAFTCSRETILEIPSGLSCK